MTTCPRCGTPLSADAQQCPRCGLLLAAPPSTPQFPPQPPWHQQPDPQRRRSAGLTWLVVAMALLLVAGLSIGGTALWLTRDSGPDASAGRAKGGDGNNKAPQGDAPASGS